jgi:BASS family bile acid:Na+ symporter
MAIPSFNMYRADIIFLMALICGYFFPQGAQIGQAFILPALTIIITVALLRFPRGFFRNPGSLFYSSFHGNIMSYIVLGNFIILTSAILIQKQELWIGMVLVAAMPASVDIILPAFASRANKNSVLTGLTGTYFGALLIIPIVSYCFLKYMHLSAWNITILILLLIVMPLVLSRLVIDKSWDENIKDHEETMLDYSSFIVFYAITANSKRFLVSLTSDLIFIIIIALTGTLLFTFLIGRIGLYFRAQDEKMNTLILLGTMKNCGLAGGIALTIFRPEVAVPALVFAVFTFINMNWIKLRGQKKGEGKYHRKLMFD